MLKLLLLAGLVALVVMWWRGAQTRKRDAMPLSEARALLGVGPNDDQDQIRAAHRRIMARVHPDAGGTEELARQANLARDALLRELARTRNN